MGYEALVEGATLGQALVAAVRSTRGEAPVSLHRRENRLLVTARSTVAMAMVAVGDTWLGSDAQLTLAPEDARRIGKALPGGETRLSWDEERLHVATDRGALQAPLLLRADDGPQLLEAAKVAEPGWRLGDAIFLHRLLAGKVDTVVLRATAGAHLQIWEGSHLVATLPMRGGPPGEVRLVRAQLRAWTGTLPTGGATLLIKPPAGLAVALFHCPEAHSTFGLAPIA